MFKSTNSKLSAKSDQFEKNEISGSALRKYNEKSLVKAKINLTKNTNQLISPTSQAVSKVK